jgi:hypothetical protein
MKRYDSPDAEGSKGGRAWCDEHDLTVYPVLHAWMTDARWDDGKSRETTTVIVCVDQGTLKACVNDRDSGKSAWLSSDSLEGLFLAIECHLRDGSMPWRDAKRGRSK